MEEVMELTKIADVRNRLIRNLSKGYCQRTGFAQAVLGYPKVIILDEPTVGLDPKQIIEIRELVQSLGKKHTVILSSHILSEVREVCEHIFILSKGKLVASDTTQNLIHKASDGQEISLLLKGETEAAASALLQAGLTQYRFAPDSEPGCCIAVLKAQGNGDIREQAFYAFANAGIPILEMGACGRSLEEIFLELTNPNAGLDISRNMDAGSNADTDFNTMASTDTGAETRKREEGI